MPTGKRLLELWCAGEERENTNKNQLTEIDGGGCKIPMPAVILKIVC